MTVSAKQGFFRSLRKATAGQFAAARSAATMGIEFYDALVEPVELPPLSLTELPIETPEVAAATLRATWGMSEGPLPNLVQLAESRGIRVIGLPVDADTVDAFSLWWGETPYIFLTTHKTAERTRFDLAHELGHLVMHTEGATGRVEQDTRELEREANAFASAFLMPKGDVLAKSMREPAVPQILNLKQHYRVSAMAMTYRLHSLGRLTDWAYRQNCVQLTQRGYRIGEPDGMPRERSRVFPEVLRIHRDKGTRPSIIAARLGLTTEDVHYFTLGEVPLVLIGDGRDGRDGAQHGPGLRLVH